jgi:hypothetical protein
MGRKSFYILSCGFTFSTLKYQFSSTTVESALQIHPFLQNEPNFRKSQVNVTVFITMNYEQMDTWSIRKNKPKTKPIQTQYKPNTNPIQTQTNPISDYTCIFGLAVYNLVFRDRNLANFYGDYLKWRMLLKPMQ